MNFGVLDEMIKLKIVSSIMLLTIFLSTIFSYSIALFTKESLFMVSFFLFDAYQQNRICRFLFVSKIWESELNVLITRSMRE